MTTLLDTTIRRDAQLLRFGTYLKNEYIVPTMQDLSREIPNHISGYDELNKAERNKLVREVRAIVSGKMNAMFDSITGELHLLTGDEAEFMLELYDDYTTETMKQISIAAAVSSADNAVISLVNNGVTSAGIWSDFVKQNVNKATQMVDSVVLSGFRNASTLQQITTDLRGNYNRGTKRYSGGVLNGRATQYAETLARTGVSHYAARARDRFAEQNSDIFDSKVFFATLDSRTTTTCLGFHANKYKLNDDSAPVLPLHYNERSVYLYAGDGIDPLEGTRPLTGGKHSKAAREEFESRQSRTNKQVVYKGRKDSGIFEIENVSAKVTSQEWLQRQPRWFVESTLGKTKAKLFLDGGLKIDKLTDLRGRPLTLAELKQTAAGEKAFRRIGG